MVVKKNRPLQPSDRFGIWLPFIQEFAWLEIAVYVVFLINLPLNVYEKKDMLDDIDLKILRLLQTNAQLTNREIAQSINLSITPVHDRIKKLEREGIIDRYVTLLNREKLQQRLVVYCNVTLDKQRQENFQEFNEAIQQLPEVVECVVVSGAFDYLLKVVSPDVTSYHTFYQEKLASIKAVSHISSFFVMAEIKNTTALPI